MNKESEIDNQLEENSVSSQQDNVSETQGHDIVYIAELNGEFFTVDYNSEDDNPTVTPLKVVEFINPTAQQLTDQEIVSNSSNPDSDLKFPQTESQLSNAPQPSKQRMSSKKSLALGIGLGVLAAWGGMQLLSASSDPETATQEASVPLTQSQKRSVTIAPVKNDVVDRTIEVSGTVNALELIPITSQISGLQIQEILVDEGTRVRKGQVLARLKNDTIQAEYAQAQAAVDGAKARLAELEAGARTEEIARAQERVNRAKAAVEQAESDLALVDKRVERNSNLEAEGAISRDRLDEINSQQQISRANLAQAEASLQEATQELRQLQNGARPEVISQAKADLAQAEGRLQYASVQLNDTEIQAVTDGIVAERNAKVGDLTSPSQTLFTIIENGSLELRLDVPETDLSKIEPGQKVTITNSQNNGAPIIGQVREIDPIVDSDSRQASVKVNLPSGTNLQPGMFLEAAITTSKNQALTVPIKAVLPQVDDQAIAYVLQPNNSVEAREVTMGEILSDNRIEIVRGLDSDEQVVVKGATYLKDGDFVSVETDVLNDE